MAACSSQGSAGGSALISKIGKESSHQASLAWILPPTQDNLRTTSTSKLPQEQQPSRADGQTGQMGI